jgi:hypothetical protein
LAGAEVETAFQGLAHHAAPISQPGRLYRAPRIPGCRPGRLSSSAEAQAYLHAYLDGTRIGNHTFRVTGIAADLKNGGTLEKTAAMANHASTRTTRLHDRPRDELSLDEVERIPI